jgi:pimeloyl-ACP methyl ester carboxylesterase
MKKYFLVNSLLLLLATTLLAQNNSSAQNQNKMNNYEILKSESHLPGLKIALLHKRPEVISKDYPIVFLSGSSIPSSLSLTFRMGNYSWMDNLIENGYDVYAVDFLGFGYSDRYPEMKSDASTRKLTGRATDVYLDVAKAIDFICKKTGKDKVYLIAHSWGGSVAALYATKFKNKIEKLVLYATITLRKDNEKPEVVTIPYKIQTPAQRMAAFKNLTPPDKECRMEKEMFETFGNDWLRSDPLSTEFKTDSVRYPSGPLQDIEDLLHNKPYYDPSKIEVPVLIVRGEWDDYPDNNDNEVLFKAIEHSPYKKYVVIEKSSHIIHWEKSRYELYDETLHFLKLKIPRP